MSKTKQAFIERFWRNFNQFCDTLKLTLEMDIKEFDVFGGVDGKETLDRFIYEIKYTLQQKEYKHLLWNYDYTQAHIDEAVADIYGSLKELKAKDLIGFIFIHNKIKPALKSISEQAMQEKRDAEQTTKTTSTSSKTVIFKTGDALTSVAILSGLGPPPTETTTDSADDIADDAAIVHEPSEVTFVPGASSSTSQVPIHVTTSTKSSSTSLADIAASEETNQAKTITK